MNFLNKLNHAAATLDLCNIFNMDETPFYFVQMEKKTIDIAGSKSVGVNNSGNDKSRFTVVVTHSADGRLLPFYVILRGMFTLRFLSFNNNFSLKLID
jgi:hypothetical protein